MVFVAVVTAWRLHADGAKESPPDSGIAGVATEHGRSFLREYLASDGRVVRIDEGGDVVSEGQAYGMLIAAAIDDEPNFRLIWSWTQTNLLRSDGLLAWRWYEGGVTDANSASDADLDAARALILAGDRFGAPDLTSHGRRLAAAVLDGETRPGGDGYVMVAGNWATAHPQQVNASYFSPRAEQELARFDARWSTVSTGNRGVIERLIQQAPLPPDWAELNGDAISAVGHGSAPVQFGLDAARVPIRLAESCAHEDRELAAAMRIPLSVQPSAVGIRHLDGSAAVEWKHPIALVARAAVLLAAGDGPGSARALDESAALQARYPSYYGAAWVALGDLMLRSSALGECPRA